MTSSLEMDWDYSGRMGGMEKQQSWIMERVRKGKGKVKRY